MEARAEAERSAGLPAWVLGLVPLALIVVTIGLFAALDGPGLGERNGPPVEELAVERTVLRPGEIELTVRNDGPDAVDLAQIVVNDAYLPFETSGEDVGRLGSTTVTVPYEWIEGEAYVVTLLTSTGGTVEHEIPVAAETPEADSGFYGLMALLGIYVGVIPVALGMLFLPFVRRVKIDWIRILIAFTIGLLAFLAIDATLEGLEIADEGPAAFGGTALVYVGALVAYLALSGVDGLLRRRREREGSDDAAAPAGAYLALLVAIGIGLHNLGEGLAIGSAYAAGALALGAFLVVGFAIHNTTEGLAIVAPLASERPGLRRLALLGLIAGAPAILGAWIGAAAFNSSLAALLLGAGAGAIAQVIVQLVPSIRDDEGRALHPGAVAGILAGIGVLYLTGLLVSRLMSAKPAEVARPHSGFRGGPSRRSSEAVQDYAKAIHALDERGGGPVQTTALAARLGVSPGSVTAMLKRMGELGLVSHEPYHGVTLTKSGERIALEVIRHHRLLEAYLAEVLGMPWDRVHDEAEVLEHYISEELEERLAAALGDPSHDPHGDPIPDRDLELGSDEGVALAGLESGDSGTFSRVSDSDPEMLRYLAERGIKPGAALVIRERQPFGGPVFVEVGGATHAIGGELAERMLIELTPE